MPTTINDKQPPGTEALSWLCGGMALAILPHLRHTPFWIVALAAAMILWRLGGEFRHWSLPDPRFPRLRRVLVLVAVAGFAGVFSHYHTLVGREAGTSMLVLLAGLKILETHGNRDFYISTFLAFFVIVTNFFYIQTIGTAVYMTMTVLILTTALITCNDRGRSRKPAERVRYACGLLVQSAPVMLVLFLLFPRISGPLWGLPKDAYAGHTGISDSMEPGSISQLAQSGEVAFRVQFDGPLPERAKLYWRGPVLWHNDGRKWTRSKSTYTGPSLVKVSGAPIHYAVTLEPTNQHWLFALEMPEQPPAQGQFFHDFQLQSRQAVQQRTRYELSSFLDYYLGAGDPGELRRALQLPRGAHPQAVSLAQTWHAAGNDPESVVRNALGMFNREKFYYTLSPPLLAGDNVDEFLFGTRQGFCEHYAGAFVVLMRAARIPARVVTGYQGGVFNPVGNYLIVHQRDAHAWAEVWMDKYGWVRVDPTAAVAPERILEGTGGAPLAGVPVFGRNLFTRDIVQNLSLLWDAVNNQWNQWVISYGPKKQTQFLEQIGLRQIGFGKLSLILAVAVCILLAAVMIWLVQGHAVTCDPARVLYDRFCRKVARLGTERRLDEGPLDFARRAGRKHRKLCGEMNEITRLYILARYASQNEQMAALRQHVRKFKP
ncbi:MAG: transglutaminase TgpA family protein [Gammaproteobacteria bacterium]